MPFLKLGWSLFYSLICGRLLKDSKSFFRIYIFWKKIYFISLWLVFTIYGIFWSTEILTFREAQFINLLFHYLLYMLSFALLRNIFPNPRLWRYSPMLHSGSFVILPFTFMIHLVVIFVCGMKYESKIFFSLVQRRAVATLLYIRWLCMCESVFRLWSAPLVY